MDTHPLINPVISKYQTAEMVVRITTPFMVLIVSLLNFLTNNIISEPTTQKYLILSAGTIGIFIAIPSTILIEFLRNRIVKSKIIVERELPLVMRPLRVGVYDGLKEKETWMADLIPFRYKWD
jgi:pilus assembly protein TadC